MRLKRIPGVRCLRNRRVAHARWVRGMIGESRQRRQSCVRLRDVRRSRFQRSYYAHVLGVMAKADEKRHRHRWDVERVRWNLADTFIQMLS
jgi:hypothetical protein